MRSAIHKLKRNRKANVLGSTVITIKGGFDAAVLMTSGIHLTAIPGIKKIIFAVQIIWSVRKAILLGKSASHRIRLALKARRRCAAGSLLTVNEQPTT
jgi:hypothetical protein